MGRRHASWLREVEAYLKEMGMAGRPGGGLQSIVARCTRRLAAPAYAPIPDLTSVNVLFLATYNIKNKVWSGRKTYQSADQPEITSITKYMSR